MVRHNHNWAPTRQWFGFLALSSLRVGCWICSVAHTCEERGTLLPTQGGAWKKHWHLAPPDVLESPLTSSRGGGPSSRAHKALFPTLFKEMSPRWYSYARRNDQIEWGEESQIAEGILAHHAELSYAARCLSLTFAEYPMVTGSVDPNNDAVYSITTTIIQRPPIDEDEELRLCIREAIELRASGGQAAALRRFGTAALGAALADPRFAASAQALLASVWLHRIPHRSIPRDLLLRTIRAISVGQKNPTPQPNSGEREFDEAWHQLLEALREARKPDEWCVGDLPPTLDDDLVALGLSDLDLVAGLDGTGQPLWARDEKSGRARLRPPPLLGGRMRPTRHPWSCPSSPAALASRRAPTVQGPSFRLFGGCWTTSSGHRLRVWASNRRLPERFCSWGGW